MASSIAPPKSPRSGQLAKQRGLAFHMDGARFANALATTGDSPADVTWRAGVDAMSFGFIKNGGLNAEALILFDTDLADEIAVRRKRAGHLVSKGRMLAAQILALLEDGLWLDNARAANAAAQALAKAAADRLVYPVEANELFLKVSADEAAASSHRASISTIGARAKSAWSPAGTSAPKTSSGSPPHSPLCERGAPIDLPVGHSAVHHFHRRLGLDLDRHPRPVGQRAAAMVGDLSFHYCRRRDVRDRPDQA